jgi:hypothetical protein
MELVKSIREKGKSVYCFMESTPSLEVGAIDDNPEEVMAKFESIPDWRNDQRVRGIFKHDMDALKESETLILLLPAGKSAHMEAGVAYGLGKKLILIGEQKETESLYLMFSEVYPTMEEFIKILM